MDLVRRRRTLVAPGVALCVAAFLALAGCGSSGGRPNGIASRLGRSVAAAQDRRFGPDHRRLAVEGPAKCAHAGPGKWLCKLRIAIASPEGAVDKETTDLSREGRRQRMLDRHGDRRSSRHSVEAARLHVRALRAMSLSGEAV